MERMRQEGILADTKDISAFLIDSDTERKSRILLDRFVRLEQYILGRIADGTLNISYKQLNDDAVSNGIATSREKDIRTLLYFLTVKGYTLKKEDGAHNMQLTQKMDKEVTVARFQQRVDVARFTVEWLYNLAQQRQQEKDKTTAVQFSVVELLKEMKQRGGMLFASFANLQLEDVEEALLYLSKIGALNLEGGFLVLYNAMDIRRIKDNKSRYKQEDYRMLNEFYKQKMQQVHIVGEYANLMVRDYDAALCYVQDYFQMDYRRFIAKYFKGERQSDIQRNLSPEKYKQLFGQLSERQMQIVNDKESRCIVVAAGPGSGKTRVLVHKLASLLLLEDVKHEQLLMLTFSRAAATEFKQRLMGLIGNAAHFVEIKTFHSYSFDLLGRIGNLEEADNVVARAAEMIARGEVEPNRIGKTVLVVDEAQDMSADEFALVKALMTANEEMRVIAVGDDDQNIYGFRGADSRHMQMLSMLDGSRLIEMTANYRSSRHVVAVANGFAGYIRNRLKQTPISSVCRDDGWVSVTHHKSATIYEPVVANILAKPSDGSRCVLTQTNEEAVTLVDLLRKHGINSKLVQSMDGIRFCNLAEMRHFQKYIERQLHSPMIPDELWETAKRATFCLYSNSESLTYLRRCIELFESTNKTKYWSDFREYVFESSIEDFSRFSESDVVVSTIHKAKGHEYDDVFMMVAGSYSRDDQLLRTYYVAMTRAKRRLFIHTNSNVFARCGIDEFVVDNREYGMPEEVVLQLSHKDVNLSFFKSRKKQILSLRGGSALTYANHCLYNTTGQPVAMLSNKMQNTLSDWQERGYEVSDAKVRFIVAWKPKDAPKEERETAVVLADLTLKRTEQDEANKKSQTE